MYWKRRGKGQNVERPSVCKTYQNVSEYLECAEHCAQTYGEMAMIKTETVGANRVEDWLYALSSDTSQTRQETGTRSRERCRRKLTVIFVPWSCMRMSADPHWAFPVLGTWKTQTWRSRNSTECVWRITNPIRLRCWVFLRVCVYVCVYACALFKKKWVESRVWKILNAVWTLYCKQQGPTGNVICGP